MDLSYYKINKLIWRWSEKDGAHIMPDVSLSLDRPPPALEKSEAPPAAIPKKPKPQVGDGLLKMMELHSRFKTWLETPAPPKRPGHVLAPETQPAVPPFDIQEIPGAMRKEFMPVSAKLMERWFAGALNYSPTQLDEAKGINQDGLPYPPSMIDKTTIKLDWVLKHARAKVAYDFLQTHDRLTTPRAIQALRRILGSLQASHEWVDTWKFSDKDIVNLHRNFEFQFAGVESSLSQKFDQFIAREASSAGVPDDLTGSLGSFNFYAAVGFARFNGNRATISAIIIYIKDNYTFTDEVGEPSQYLGHWSRNGVIIVPATGAAGLAGIRWPDYPVAVGDARVPGNVYYPVRNDSFRKWQQIHHRGGDFIIYSDRRYITLRQPIEIEL